jgi:hypothetical protein
MACITRDSTTYVPPLMAGLDAAEAPLMVEPWGASHLFHFSPMCYCFMNCLFRLK